MAEYKFPTEVVDLPSKGYFYVNGHPLSSGKVEIKYMTAKEEDILSSENILFFIKRSVNFILASDLVKSPLDSTKI